MSLLVDQEVKKQEPKGKKLVLFLLILSVFAVIMIIVMMMALSGKQQKPLSISINGKDIQVREGLLVSNDKGVEYISILQISKLIGYNYLTGEYKQYNEDNTNTKCYLENANQVIQFEAGSKKVYKTSPTSNLDYEEYELKNIILKQNNLIYVALEDMDVALNVIYTHSQQDNKKTLNTVENLYTGHIKSVPEKTNNDLVGVSDSFNNKKAIAYNMLVASNAAGKWGVIDAANYSNIIGNKYSSIEFIESAGVFIVSDNNKYGIINEEGKIIIDLNYESIKVINNKPLCYEIKSGQNYAIVNANGVPISNNLYDSVGYTSQILTEESVLSIEDFGEDKLNLLVVCKNRKYGLIDLDNQISIGDIVLDKIYSKTENGEKVYYVQLQEQQILLDEYIEYINTTTVNIGQ